MGRRQVVTLTVLAAACLLAAGALLVLRNGDDGTELTAAGTSTTSTSDRGTTTTTADVRSTSTTVTAATSATPPDVGAPVRPGRPVTRGGLPPAPTTTEPPSTTEPPPPPFQSSIEPVTAAQLGSSWREGCPVGPDQLRALQLSHWGYDGEVHSGRLIVHVDQAERMVAVFRDVYAARFPIQRMVPVDAYGSDDQASMRANNTSGFNCRPVAGTSSWSEHAYGRAVDVNPLVNPYVRGSTVDPPEGAPYADRSRTDPGMIHDGDAVVRAFAAQGWQWGGYWSSGKDYQHFSSTGR